MARTEVNLAEQVLGVLPVANGGTGASTLTGVLIGNGTSPITAVALNQASLPENVTVSSATTLTLANTVSTYVFTGSSATTWTLPALAGNTGVHFTLENRGSATITVNAAGSDHIWWLSSLTSMTVAAGGSLELVNDGTYWNSLSVDLVNNVVGALSVANGGTGNTSFTTNTFIMGSGGSAALSTQASPLSTTYGGTGSNAGLTGLVVGNGASAMTTVIAPAGTVVGTTDTQTLTNKTITSATENTPTVTGYTETVDTSMGTVAAGTTVIPALSLGTLKTVTLPTTGAVTFTMPTATTGQSFVLLVKQGASPGTATATFTSVVWPGGSAPVITATIGHFDAITFICFGSSIWHGTFVQNYAT